MAKSKPTKQKRANQAAGKPAPWVRPWIKTGAFLALLLSVLLWTWSEGCTRTAPTQPSDSETSPELIRAGEDPATSKFEPIRFEPVASQLPTHVAVVRVVDGDTIRVIFDGKEEPVRLIGVDTPELMNPGRGHTENQPGALEASRWLERVLAANPQVRLEFDIDQRDRYSRLLAYVWHTGQDGTERMLNEELLREGYATPLHYRPNFKYRERLEAVAAAGVMR